MVTINEVKEAMDHTTGYPVRCWWNNAAINSVINEAVQQGWLARQSTTQVSWTDAGIAALKGQIPSYDELAKAFMDIIEPFKAWYEIKYHTGVTEERAKELANMLESLQKGGY